MPDDARNQATLGYDMYSEPMRLATMDKATDTSVGGDRPRDARSGTRPHSGPGFLIYVPLYSTPDGAVPATVEERRAAISGWIYSPFRVSEPVRPRLRARGPIRNRFRGL